jgi:hypothetical protein
MTKTVSALVALVVIGCSGAALATTTPASMTNTRTPAATTGGGILVAVNWITTVKPRAEVLAPLLLRTRARALPITTPMGGSNRTSLSQCK